MAWTTPMTFVSGNTLTAAQLNTYLGANLNETAPAKATASGQWFVSTAANAIAARTISSNTVTAAETTSSTSFVDLTTTGPSVTVTTGTKAITSMGVHMQNNNASGYSDASIAISGATSRSPANDEYCMSSGRDVASSLLHASLVGLYALTAGSNTFKVQYRAQAAGTSTFQLRHLIVLPM